MTSDDIQERQHRAYLLAQARRLARREYRKPLDRLELADWREIWRQIDALEATENGGAR